MRNLSNIKDYLKNHASNTVSFVLKAVGVVVLLLTFLEKVSLVNAFPTLVYHIPIIGYDLG